MEAARPRAVVVFVPLAILDGAVSLLVGSGAGSGNVLRCLKAGSGTAVVSEQCNIAGAAGGKVQPEGLCLAVGMGIALRALVADSCSSLRARGGDDVMWEKVEGGLIPERFVIA